MNRLMPIICLLTLMLPLASQGADTKISPKLEQVLTGQATTMSSETERHGVWVHFIDKGLTRNALTDALAKAERDLPERTQQRRAKMRRSGESPVGLGDLPLAADYLAAVAATGAEPRKHSRWLNAASFNATADEVAAIADLPFVARIDLVAQFFRPDPLVPLPIAEKTAETIRKAASANSSDWNISYGGSTAGLEQINVPPVHELGLTGNGVIIGVLDGGFRTTHLALRHLSILTTWDFVENDADVDEGPGSTAHGARHGTKTLSSITAYAEGGMIGPAFNASVILARTEDPYSETPVEEDNFVAGLEWVEGLGADLVSTSLGYYMWYEFADMDGETALCTVACAEAIERGMCVVTSAGNNRGDENWPHISAPADADGIIAVGAVDLLGQIAPFSSPGPTADGRIKPDVCAQGVGNHVAGYFDPTTYDSANGTSYAAPLVAGVAALLLERIPSLTPWQVREALCQTADSRAVPGNDFGWGIIDAHAAVTYWGPKFVHDPLPSTEDLAGPYTVSAEIDAREGLAVDSARLIWRLDDGPWQETAFSATSGQHYEAEIPGPGTSGRIEYYLRAANKTGIVLDLPHGAPQNVYAFSVGTDTSVPELFHAGIIDQTMGTWPPAVFAWASDDIGVDRVELYYALNEGAEQGPFPLVATDDDTYELDFPLTADAVGVGDALTYRLVAWDTASQPNSTASESETFFVKMDIGEVLVIDNNQFNANAVRNNASDMALWAEMAGYSVDIVNDTDVTATDLAGYDALIVSCGANPMPLADETVRSYLQNWVAGGGRLLIESGEIGQATHNVPGYPGFGESVLRTRTCWGDMIGTTDLFPIEDPAFHHFLCRPYRLPPIGKITPQGVIDPAAGDIVVPAQGALMVLHTASYEQAGGVLLYDDNTGPETGQIVYLSFAIDYMTPGVGKLFVANALAYLTAQETPGEGSISGTVILADGGDASGVIVSTNTGQSTITGPGGTYSLTGLHGAEYALAATVEGYSPGSRRILLHAGQAIEDIEFVLQPVQVIAISTEPGVAIPDYDPVGIASTLAVTEGGFLNSLSVDIDITHASRGQLVVTLTSPTGTTVTLHNRNGHTADDLVGNWPETLNVDGPGSLADFQGEPVIGVWTLNVADEQFGGWGSLDGWGLNLLAGASVVPVSPEDLPLVSGFTGNVPNPFNPQTEIRFNLTAAGPVVVEVFDLRGRHIRQLKAGYLAAGAHRFTWDGRDGSGRDTSSGVYVCRLRADGTTHLHKMMLLR